MTSINKIFIIQSLETKDILKSGEELSQRLSKIIPVNFQNVETDVEVFEHLDKIRDEINLTKERYIIHFDCHGNEDGIAIFDKTDNVSFIDWEDMRDKLRDIYLITKQRLIISFSSCEGLNVVKLIAAFKPCPFELITGSFKKIGFRDSVDGYELFYKSIHKGDKLEDAMGKTRLRYPKLDFVSFPTLRLVKLGWDGYFKTQLSPDKVAERKEQIISEIISLKGIITQPEIDFIEMGLSKEAAKKDYERYVKIFWS